MRFLSLIVCTTLLVQMIWPGVALSFKSYNASTNDAIRNGLFFEFAGVRDTLPDNDQAVTNIFDFVAVPGVDSLYGRAIANRIDSTKLNLVETLDSMLVWSDPYTEVYYTYDFDSLIANPLDTVYFPHIIIDTSLLDSGILLGSDTRVRDSLLNKIRLQVTNKVENNDTSVADNNLVALFADVNKNGVFDTGDTAISSTDSIALVPGESLHVLVQTLIPIVTQDSSMDTVSLIVQTARDIQSQHTLTKIYKDVITIELIQAFDAMAWIDPDTVVAGTDVTFTYGLQLILGTADKFILVNPFAAMFDSDSITVDSITFTYDNTNFDLENTLARPRDRDSAAWYYEEATDSLYLKFKPFRLNDRGTVFVYFRQTAPESLPDVEYWDTTYMAIFDDSIDVVSPPDTADTILGIPVVTVVPDSARKFDVYSIKDSVKPTIFEIVRLESLVVRDQYDNRIYEYDNPYSAIQLEARNVHTGLVSPYVQFTINGIQRDSIPVNEAFDRGRYIDKISAVSSYPDTVVIWFMDSVNTIVGVSDTIFWIDRIPPQIVATAVYDTNGNGILDRVAIAFDSPVQNMNEVGFSISGFGLDPFNSYVVINDSALYLNISESNQIPNTGVPPIVTYNSLLGSIEDQAQFPNALVDYMAAATDSAAPVIVQASYFDNSTDDKMKHRLLLVVSELINTDSLDAFAKDDFEIYIGDLGNSYVENTGKITDSLYITGLLGSAIDVEQDSVRIITGAIADLLNNRAAANNQRVLVQDKTSPFIVWVEPISDVSATELTKLRVTVEVTEWQYLPRKNVELLWEIRDNFNAIVNADSIQLGAQLTQNQGVIPFSVIIDLTNYPQFGQLPLRGGHEIIFTVVATDQAGNRTVEDSIQVLRVDLIPRWYHNNRGASRGYTGFGIHDGKGPFDAWAYVDSAMIIFDSISIRNYYNGEINNTVLESTITTAIVKAAANQNYTNIDPQNNVKIVEYAIVDKKNNSRRYISNKEDNTKVVIEIYYDDLTKLVSDIQNNEINEKSLRIFKLDDFQIVNGTDTVHGTGEWMPMPELDHDWDFANKMVRLTIDAQELAELQPNSFSRGLGVFTLMLYKKPATVLSSGLNYPNPFNPLEKPTTISYILTEDADVEITITSLIGDLVWTQSFTAGLPGGAGADFGFQNQVTWDGRNEKGRVVANGGYICVIKATSNITGTVYKDKRKIAILK